MQIILILDSNQEQDNEQNLAKINNVQIQMNVLVLESIMLANNKGINNI